MVDRLAQQKIVCGVCTVQSTHDKQHGGGRVCMLTAFCGWHHSLQAQNLFATCKPRRGRTTCQPPRLNTALRPTRTVPTSICLCGLPMDDCPSITAAAHKRQIPGETKYGNHTAGNKKHCRQYFICPLLPMLSPPSQWYARFAKQASPHGCLHSANTQAPT